MAKKQPENKLLSKRVNFPSMGVVLDEYVPQFAKCFGLSETQTEEFRQALITIFERFLWDANYAAAKGAEKGINEAFELFKDPQYYEVAKRRKDAERERMRAQYGTPTERAAKEKEQERERDRRVNNPTRDEQVSEICQGIRQMGYYRRSYNQHKDRIQELTEKSGTEIIVEAFKRMTDIDENLWFANFDVDSFVRALSEINVDRPVNKKTPGIIDEAEDFFDKHSSFEDEE